MASDRKKPSADAAPFDKEMVRELASLLEETGLAEIEVETAALRVRIARAVQPVSGFIAPIAAPPAQVAHAPQGRAEPPPASDDPAKHPGVVTSPMVGTAYFAPEPDANPFVRLGDTVTKGQTLLIVEAMKTMNPIAAPHAGKIVRILIENEQPVEFGQPLMIIE